MEKAAVGIVRISGSEAISLSQRLFRPRSETEWRPQSHRIYLGDVVDVHGKVLDEVRFKKRVRR